MMEEASSFDQERGLIVVKIAHPFPLRLMACVCAEQEAGRCPRGAILARKGSGIYTISGLEWYDR